MVYVGIDVAKDKHDCFIQSSEGTVLADVFTIPNSMEGFCYFSDKLRSVIGSKDKIKVGLEATGHYSYNLLGFRLDSGLDTYVLNPLHTNLYTPALTITPFDVLRHSAPEQSLAKSPRKVALSPARPHSSVDGG